MTQERFFELVYAWKDGDLTGDELYQRVFVLSNVVGQREQLKCPNCGSENKRVHRRITYIPCYAP